MKALIFDMDGLMIDSERLYFQSERDIAGSFGKEIKEEILWRMMGRNPLEGLEILVSELKLPISPQEAVSLRNELMREKMKSDLRAMPGLFQIIDAFYGELKLAVSTGAQKEFLEMAVNELGIREKFDVLQASDDIQRGKPDPEIFLKTCEKLGLEPGDCIILEDSENGVRAGWRAGCYVIAVPSEYTRKQDFRIAHYVAADLYSAAEHITAMLGHAGPVPSST
jgi:HAD superfamily hydrolase (TIGR01509 family)